MGRFDSPLQVVGLFLAASIVSVGVIFFLNAEAHSRQSHHHQGQLPEPAYLQDMSWLHDQQTEEVGDYKENEISDVSLSSSPSSELTSNYTSASIAGVSLAPTAANVTLLNFLEDGLEKLLVLIKQAKNTYKSYYLSDPEPTNSIQDEKHPSPERDATASRQKRSMRKKRELRDKAFRQKMKRAAVISPSKRGRMGENEPYYWQMLEDTNKESHKKKKEAGLNQQRSDNEPQYSQKHKHHSNHGESNHFYPVGVPGAGPAVASAFTSSSSDANILHSHHSSDFHKIRHAMNKLGGGGLDISVVERMILDTKSGGGRGHSGQNQGQRFGHPHFAPGQNKKENGHGHSHGGGKGSNEALLTTATTKTTHPGRQEEGLYVNQLRHQQQQLAQSLLPPTVTWLSGEGSSGDTQVRYLPLPSSSLATGKDDEDKDEGESDDIDDLEDNEEERIERKGDEDSDENSVASSTNKGRKAKKEREQKRKLKLKRKNKKNNELSYSSPREEESDEKESRSRSAEEDYPLPFTQEEEEAEDVEHNGDEHLEKESGNLLMIDEDNDNDEEEDEEGLLFPNGGDDNLEEDDGKEKERRGEVEHHHPTNALEHDGKDCYRTDDVLIVVAITCCLNFAFVLVIWALVRWFSISTNPKEKDFQNLGDCDDTLDPTVVFHGVTEDPCWALATKEASSGSGGGSTVMTLRSTATTSGGGIGRSHYDREGVGYMGTMGSIHSGNKVDLFPKHGGSSLTNTIGAAVMTMTAERRGLSGAGMYGHSGGGGPLMISGSGAGLYSHCSFKPEHVPVHHGSSGQMHRSYSQSMEDLRYIQ